jgi:hypothetical protein
MAAVQPRIGLEIEFHKMRMTFQRGEPGLEGTFWNAPVGTADTTMMGHDPILIPLNADPNVFATLANVPWDGNWGFIANGDDFTTATEVIAKGDKNDDDLTKGVKVDVTTCVLEFGSGAHTADDAYHWIFSRRCAKAFRDTLFEMRTGRTAPPLGDDIARQAREFFKPTPLARWWPLSLVSSQG